MMLTIRTPEQIAAEAGEEHKARCARAIDALVDGRARALGYNGAAHLAGYVASGVPQWRAEAEQFVAWRDAVWSAAIDMLAAADPAAPPPVESVLAALPPWPDD